jgi:hypothetical protein
VGRGDKVDVMAFRFILEVDHFFSQGVNFDFIVSLCLRILANLDILAENAPEITVAEENCTGAPGTGKNRFFSVVGDCRRYGGKIGRITESSFTVKTINSTIPGADIAGR